MKNYITIELSPEELSRIVQQAVCLAIEKVKDPTPESEKLLDRRETKSLLKIASDTTIINFEKKGILHPVKIGKKILYREADVQEALQKIHR
jgi:hypothetical protein